MKRSVIPSLDDLRAFEAVGRLGSIRGAAAELALTHGAVSRRVSKLSLDLGLRLTEAEGRGIGLTREGAKLADATGKAFALLTDCLADLHAGLAAPPIVLSCERSLAMRWLIPRLSRFQDKHPSVDVHLSTGGGAIDFTRDHVSLAIRRLDFPIQPDWVVTGLMLETVGPVMAPSLLAAFEGGDYVALASRTRAHAWDAWLSRNPSAPRPRTTWMVDHHFLMIEAALGGLGVALSPHAISIDEVAAGRLQAPLGYTPDGTEYGLIHPKTMVFSPDLTALRDWLLALPVPEEARIPS
ncbi:MAG: transcriptional regulator [Stutzerimonas stutzeri]|nr:MAG: transcriptional regulator [Stutzerimonas stutzeri]